MRYTAEATMEERTLRDVERWKDKIEVRLDNRQVFFLFFGSALVACLLFTLGVIVGKRLESRGHAAAPEIEDPLALLDRVATRPATGAGEESLTFQRALIPSGSGRSKSAASIPAVEPPIVEPVAISVVEAKPKPVLGVPVPVNTPVAVASAPSMPEVKVEKPVIDKPAPLAAVATTATEPVPASTDARAFALQIGSFQDRAEADAFMTKFVGESPYIVVSDIPDKGVWYRVRLGSFSNNADAIAGKKAFERKHHMIAYVAPK
ncbi:MAG: SPOR domain-containing protein [Deltaproteobacteria bacterium]|nr:SPOR domain-containing protein [Deltaproteobacteria bacterium]